MSLPGDNSRISDSFTCDFGNAPIPPPWIESTIEIKDAFKGELYKFRPCSGYPSFEKHESPVRVNTVIRDGFPQWLRSAPNAQDLEYGGNAGNRMAKPVKISCGASQSSNVGSAERQPGVLHRRNKGRHPLHPNQKSNLSQYLSLRTKRVRKEGNDGSQTWMA